VSINIPQDKINKVIKIINDRHHTNFQFLNQYEGGEWGAFRIAESGKAPVVLKYYPDISENSFIDPDPNLAPLITTRLLELGCPVPKYIFTGTLEPNGLYWIQEELLGKPLSQDPSVEQVKKMLSLIDLQKNQAVSTKQNWSRIAREVVFANKFGWCESLKSFSNETAELVDMMLNATKGLENLELPTSDIVHGDFSYRQVMVENDQIVGIIDWQEAGCGDLAIDLSRLVYSLHDRPLLVAPIVEKLKVHDPRKIKLYIAFTAFEMVGWRIDQNPGLDKSVAKAGSALDFVYNELMNF